MNKRDQKNLAFLLAQTADSLRQWWQQADAEDIAYAEQLLARAQPQPPARRYEHQHQPPGTLQ